jgi:ABC-2 type transport system permease protein
VTLSILTVIIYLLYRVSILQIGWWFLPFYLCTTMMGWAVGFVAAAIVIKHGQKMQTVVWTLPGILLPFSAVYFPLVKLPAFIQPISRLLPTTYIFESARGLVFEGHFPIENLFISFGLGCLYLLLSTLYFVHNFRKSCELGLGRFD